MHATWGWVEPSISQRPPSVGAKSVDWSIFVAFFFFLSSTLNACDKTSWLFFDPWPAVASRSLPCELSRVSSGFWHLCPQHFSAYDGRF